MRIALIGCSSKKRAVPSRADELYLGNLFRLSRQWVEARAHVFGGWGILSAKYGLLLPSDVIPPYDQYTIPPGWGEHVRQQIIEVWGDPSEIIFTVLAGDRYVAPLRGLPMVENVFGGWAKHRKESGHRKTGIGILMRELKRGREVGAVGAEQSAFDFDMQAAPSSSSSPLPPKVCEHCQKRATARHSRYCSRCLSTQAKAEAAAGVPGWAAAELERLRRAAVERHARHVEQVLLRGFGYRGDSVDVTEAKRREAVRVSALAYWTAPTEDARRAAYLRVLALSPLARKHWRYMTLAERPPDRMV